MFVETLSINYPNTRELQTNFDFKSHNGLKQDKI